MARLITWSVRSEVDRFRDRIDRLFYDFFPRSPCARSFEGADWVPAIDVSESGKEILVYAEVPGMEEKDIDISLNGRILTIKGERTQEQEEKDKSYHCLERRHGSFSRSLELPANVDASRVTAVYKNGVLKLNMPKTEKKALKKIEVKTS